MTEPAAPLPDTDRRILEFVRFSAGSDRAELARDLELPRPTVTSAVRRLVAAGLLVDVDADSGRAVVGRGRHLLRASGRPQLLGLLSWKSGLLHARLYDFDGVLRFEESCEAPDPDAGADGLVPAIEALQRAGSAHPDLALSTVVISASAPYLRGIGAPEHAPQREVRAASVLPLPVSASGDLDRQLAARFGLAFITENDANLAALGEQFGSTRPRRHFIYLRMDADGLGSAVVANGQLVRGSRGYAGELAHLQIDRDGPLCHCGGRGCFWPRVHRMAMDAARHGYDETVTFADLPRLSDAGDARATRVLTDVGRAIGQPLGHLCTFLDPEVVVVDGRIGPSIEHVVAGLRETFAVYAPPAIAHGVTFETGTLGDQAEVHGALEIPRESVRRGAVG